jgi:DNA-binding IclR family transcriptional regulator
MGKDEVVNDRYKLQSVEKAVNILNLFYDATELSASEIAKKLGMTRVTAFRFLTTLEFNGLLIRTSRARYRLGLKLYSLGQLAYKRFNFSSLSRPYLQKLMEITGETTFIGISDGAAGVIYVDRVVSSSTLRVDILLGSKLAAHLTAIGKAILAYQPEKFLANYMETADFSPRTVNTITTPSVLYQELESVKINGYSCDNEESEIGLMCYGAAILDDSGISIAGISVSGPTSRMRENKERVISAITETVRSISAAISH